VATVYDGDAPDAIDRSFIGRAISVGFEWVLLGVGAMLVVATIFGMFVRERQDEDFAYVPPSGGYAPVPAPPTTQETATMPAVMLEEETGEERPATPVRIREVRHWEEEEAPPQEYRSGWRQTWPDPKKQGPTLPWEQEPPPKRPSPRRVNRTRPESEPPKGSRRDVIRDFVSEDDDET
jgi:hypothetical protein